MTRSTLRTIAMYCSVVAAFIVVARLLTATVAYVPSNQWAPTGDLQQARAGAASALLYDGHILVTGGLDATGAPSATAERYSPDGGQFLATPTPMSTARANHTATLLADGRVLVAGGVSASGLATASVEIFDGATNSWTPGPSLNAARSSHTATALYDGRIVIAGGSDGANSLATIEIYDPITNTFALSNTALSAARTGHAAAQTYDGIVAIAGGFDGASVLASIDLYDPFSDTVTAGPALATARAGHSATTLLDGKILLAGGAGASTELNSAEVYDPVNGTVTATANAMSTARQHHQAILLPHNSQVLILGGTAGAAGDAVNTAELYVAWQGNGGTFFAANPPSAGRAWSAAAPLSFNPGLTIRSGPNDGLLLLTGGSAKADASNPLASSELYGFATVKTDKADYGPGGTVTVTEAGGFRSRP
jgi:N-acetylneuraminic acid mutarotase